jgi:hypothetical protein
MLIRTIYYMAGTPVYVKAMKFITFFKFKMIAAYNSSNERKMFLYNLLSVFAFFYDRNSVVAPGFKIFIEPHKHNLL